MTDGPLKRMFELGDAPQNIQKLVKSLRNLGTEVSAYSTEWKDASDSTSEHFGEVDILMKELINRMGIGKKEAKELAESFNGVGTSGTVAINKVTAAVKQVSTATERMNAAKKTVGSIGKAEKERIQREFDSAKKVDKFQEDRLIKRLQLKRKNFDVIEGILEEHEAAKLKVIADAQKKIDRENDRIQVARANGETNAYKERAARGKKARSDEMKRVEDDLKRFAKVARDSQAHVDKQAESILNARKRREVEAYVEQSERNKRARSDELKRVDSDLKRHSKIARDAQAKVDRAREKSRSKDLADQEKYQKLKNAKEMAAYAEEAANKKRLLSKFGADRSQLDRLEDEKKYFKLLRQEQANSIKKQEKLQSAALAKKLHAEERYRDKIIELRKYKKAFGDDNKELRAITETHKKRYNQAKKYSDKGDKLLTKERRAYKQLGDTISNVTDKIAKENKKLQASQVGIVRGNDGVAKSFKRAGNAADRSGISLQQWQKHAVRLLRYFVLTTAAYTAMREVQQAVIVGMDFEQEITTAAGVMGIAGENATKQFEALEEAALKAGRTTEKTAKDAASGLLFLGKAGLEAHQAIAALPEVLDLSTATGLDLGRAADIVTNAMTAMKISIFEVSKASSVLVATTTSSNVNMEEMSESMEQVALIANSYGYEISQVAAMLGIMGDSGTKGSKAGTQLAKAMQKAQDVFYYYSVGLTEAQRATVGLADALDLLKDRQATAGDIAAIFGDRGKKAVTALLYATKEYANGADAVRAYTERLKSAKDAHTELADIMRGTTKGAVEELKSTFESLQLSSFDVIKKDFADSVKSLTAFLRENKDTIIELVKWLYTAGKAFLLFFGILAGGYVVRNLGMMIAGLVLNLRTLSVASIQAGVAMRGFTAILLSNPFLAVAAGVAAVATVMYTMTRATDEATSATEKLTEKERDQQIQRSRYAVANEEDRAKIDRKEYIDKNVGLVNKLLEEQITIKKEINALDRRAAKEGIYNAETLAGMFDFGQKPAGYLNNDNVVRIAGSYKLLAAQAKSVKDQFLNLHKGAGSPITGLPFADEAAIVKAEKEKAKLNARMTKSDEEQLKLKTDVFEKIITQSIGNIGMAYEFLLKQYKVQMEQVEKKVSADLLSMKGRGDKTLADTTEDQIRKVANLYAQKIYDAKVAQLDAKRDKYNADMTKEFDKMSKTAEKSIERYAKLVKKVDAPFSAILLNFKNIRKKTKDDLRAMGDALVKFQQKNKGVVDYLASSDKSAFVKGKKGTEGLGVDELEKKSIVLTKMRGEYAELLKASKALGDQDEEIIKNLEKNFLAASKGKVDEAKTQLSDMSAQMKNKLDEARGVITTIEEKNKRDYLKFAAIINSNLDKRIALAKKQLEIAQSQDGVTGKGIAGEVDALERLTKGKAEFKIFVDTEGTKTDLDVLKRMMGDANVDLIDAVELAIEVRITSTKSETTAKIQQEFDKLIAAGKASIEQYMHLIDGMNDPFKKLVHNADKAEKNLNDKIKRAEGRAKDYADINKSGDLSKTGDGRLMMSDDSKQKQFDKIKTELREMYGLREQLFGYNGVVASQLRLDYLKPFSDEFSKAEDNIKSLAFIMETKLAVAQGNLSASGAKAMQELSANMKVALTYIDNDVAYIEARMSAFRKQKPQGFEHRKDYKEMDKELGRAKSIQSEIKVIFDKGTMSGKEFKRLMSILGDKTELKRYLKLTVDVESEVTQEKTDAMWAEVGEGFRGLFKEIPTSIQSGMASAITILGSDASASQKAAGVTQVLGTAAIESAGLGPIGTAVAGIAVKALGDGIGDMMFGGEDRIGQEADRLAEAFASLAQSMADFDEELRISGLTDVEKYSEFQTLFGKYKTAQSTHAGTLSEQERVTRAWEYGTYDKLDIGEGASLAIDKLTGKELFTYMKELRERSNATGAALLKAKQDMNKFREMILEMGAAAVQSIKAMKESRDNFYRDRRRSTWGTEDYRSQLIKDRQAEDMPRTMAQALMDAIARGGSADEMTELRTRLAIANMELAEAMGKSWETEQALVASLDEMIEANAATTEALKGLHDSLGDTRQSLLDGALNPDQSFAYAEKRYNELRDAAITDPTEENIKAYQQYISTYLEKAKSYYGSTDDYERIFKQITDQSGDITSVQDAITKAMEANTEAITLLTETLQDGVVMKDGSIVSGINPSTGLPWDQAANGGYFSGPLSGYPVTLHGNEAVVPMSNISSGGSVGTDMSGQQIVNLLGTLIEVVGDSQIVIDGDKFEGVIRKVSDENRIEAEGTGMYERRQYI